MMIYNKRPSTTDIQLEDTKLEQIHIQLWRKIIDDEDRVKGNIDRIEHFKVIFSKKKTILTSRNINLETPKQCIKRFVWSIAQ